MPHKTELPRGIRNNNPGNLRRATLAETPSQVIDGYAVFRSTQDGLQNLARIAANYYNHLALKTPFDFVSRYAPASENDVHSYLQIVCPFARCTIERAKTHDLRLVETWRMLDWMRGIVIAECGYPPPNFSIGGEWFAPSELWTAITIGLAR